MYRFAMIVYYVLSAPISILFILNSKSIHPSYRMSCLKKIKLGFKMFIDKIRIPTATSYKSHLAMALKILETPPKYPGALLSVGRGRVVQLLIYHWSVESWEEN